MEAQDHLQLEKLENRRINKALNEVRTEVERKTSIMKRQKEEQENSQKAMNSLNVKLEQTINVCELICVRETPEIFRLLVKFRLLFLLNFNKFLNCAFKKWQFNNRVISRLEPFSSSKVLEVRHML